MLRPAAHSYERESGVTISVILELWARIVDTVATSSPKTQTRLNSRMNVTLKHHPFTPRPTQSVPTIVSMFAK